ncbi:hypothetical protein [Antrihabitans stalactiti]|uniref:hypothetical protein n=1 Tax=Antrihabitans stalactiti TaxID=2584121 RepID=UPI001F0EEF15|nr:hypothetical protein [Antrihabitans stalactiti]
MTATAIATTDAASKVTRHRNDTDRVNGIGGRISFALPTRPIGATTWPDDGPLVRALEWCSPP